MREVVSVWPESMLIRTAADYLECSPAQVEKLIRAGDLHCHSLTDGGDRRISRKALDAFIDSREQRGIISRSA